MDHQLIVLFKEHLDAIQANFSKLMETFSLDYLAIHSGQSLGYYADDQRAPFRETPMFSYACPAKGEGHILLFQPGKKPKLYFKIKTGFWYAPQQLGKSFWEDCFDINSFCETKELKSLFPKSSGALIGPPHAETEALFEKGSQLEALIGELNGLRSKKSEFEKHCMIEANRIAALGHKAAEKAFLEEQSELGIHLSYLSATETAERELPYLSIVGLNSNAATLHYEGKTTQGGGSTMLIDAGVRYLGYCSDISRSYFSRAGIGQPAPCEQAIAVYKFLLAEMESLQSSICAAVKPGVLYSDLHQMTLNQIAKLALESGLIKNCTLEQAIENNLARVFFPHGLGHFLGIQVHDVGAPQKPSSAHPFLRNTRPIEEKQVFTIEPGFYFIESLFKEAQVEHSNNFDQKLFKKLVPCGGIRIEDNLYVTPSGSENLTKTFLP